MAKATRSATARKSTPAAEEKPAYPQLPDGNVHAPFREQSYTSQDGLRLVYSDYGPRRSERTPVICLAGLTRNARDFHELASWLATVPGYERRVIVPDYRGRGRSEYDRNWENYSLAVELQDVLDLLTTLDIERAIFIGTSRGGLISMLLGAARPGAIAGVLLNDIGPVIEPQGLLRIRQYMRERPAARGWDEAADALKRMWSALYPKLSDEEWGAMAHKIYRDANGRIMPDYDPNLLKPLEGLDLDKAGPPLWAQFATLSHVSVLCLRGENSDILAPKTVSEMRQHHPDFESATIPDSGHAPLLIEMPVLRLIAGFAAHCG